jgi:pSer/pThr/pTyr-binding forkhead associated (FHA) protein/ABC-type multidrug transport system ATPase subunit
VSSTNNGKLFVVEGPSAGSDFELTQANTSLGREQGVDIVLVATSVSRRHAQVTRDNNQYYIEDLGSSNGTLVNGQRISSRQLLKNGDQIGLGQSVVLRFDAPPPDDATAIYDPGMAEAYPPTAVSDSPATTLEPPMAAAPPRPAPQPQAAPTFQPQLIITIGNGVPQTYDLNKPQLTVGRSPSSDIVLNSNIISRLHATLREIPGGYSLDINPQAGNAIFIHGRPLTQAYTLADGDELVIGQTDPTTRVTLRYRGLPAEDFATQVGGPSQDDSSTQIAAPVAPPVRPIPAPAGGDYAGVGTQIMSPGDFQMGASSGPPRFMVAIAGNPSQTYTLTKDRYSIGRSPENDIVIDSKIVSRTHARLERLSDGTYQMVPSPDAGNPVHLEGRPLSFSRRLKHNDKLRIGGQDPGLMVTMTFLAPSEAAAVSGPDEVVDFAEKTIITIGRDETNDVVVDSPVVSRYHAQVERVGQRYRVRDLRSANGTFVNDVQVEGEVWLKPDDSVRIGTYRFVMGQNQLAQFEESAGFGVEAVGLNKWVRKDLNILKNISLEFNPREFIVVVGQSGGGKSTLVDAIAGYRPATHGTVEVNGINVYKNFDAIRNEIGYVPQKDIIHMELTVFQALDYAAQLRMPPDTTKKERHKRIDEVLADLDLTHRKDVQISGLSGGQQKRVSIGVELLTKPGLFFLDEPTSGLDPGTETSFMHLMRRLADQGRTIILITHATKNVMLADKVAFLARGGYLTWFGPPDEALAFFDQYRSERDRRAKNIEFDEIYAILDDQSKGTPEEWGDRFQKTEAFQKYITQPLAQKGQALTADRQARPVQAKKSKRRQVSSLRQFLILSSRNVKILTRDRFSLALMLAAAPMVSLLDVILSLVLGRNPFDYSEGFMANVLITLFLLTVYGVMVGGLAQMREIVKEQDVYRRERLVNLKILPYIISKIWVAAILAAYQAAVYTFVHYFVFDMPGSWVEFGIIYVSLFLATMAGMMLGLFASALAPNANSAPLIVILLMLPQIVLGGALVPLPETISAPTSTRWAFQAFMAATGSGSDVAADACWQVEGDERARLLGSSIEAKQDFGCTCMGLGVLDPASCNFPGLGRFELEDVPPPPVEPVLIQPTPLRPEPTTPVLPPEPQRPADETDTVAIAEYLDALEAYQAQVGEIQDVFQADLAAYRAEAAVFQSETIAFQTAQADFLEAQARWEAENQAAIAKAVVPAEQVISQTERDFGWLYVDKNNESEYWGTIGTTWIAQSSIIGLLFVLILILQKRKDVI